ncbi:class I SAM-dependent methyltransferase [Legionella bononiensis]|uniref:Class I SAM-dependent methyltransferase n=2 Tax=Legionella bononiensis TaxID=2793102 RepID=A0ABS1WG23_9GAMM|nr:class I SAM-dependent methyltransferase [Legionella bononiensis]MBL7481741.1 class I SAM-dependent methyltransferase [Legionella bononiensis]MBL7528289.1 class I SAM-dependent methyltransferase [Legionella bononiensis]MBL7562764.1 class I SAM-dependent methyltransferase [Legionella bononiensis]
MVMADPKHLKAAGDKALEQGDLPLALSFYDQTIAASPQFYEAYYQKGSVLLRMGKSIEAATMFWQAYLFSQFKIEIGLMTAKTLAHAHYSFEACRLYETFEIDHIDPSSLAYYLYALRQQGRIKHAYTLLPRLEHVHTPITNWAKALIYLDMNQIEQARELLVPMEATDKDGSIAILLHAVYLALNNKTAIRSVLDNAIKRVSSPDYYCCQRIALDILDKRNKTPIDTYRSFKRFDLIDAAHYLSKKAKKKLVCTGTTYQTFEELAPQVLKEGLILEFGVRFGYSISHLGTLFFDRKIFGFDSFQGLPERWHHEHAGSYSTKGIIPQLADNIELIAGWFNETLPDFKQKHPEPVAFINIDCDLYSSTKLVLDELTEQIIPGTIIVFDEYIGNTNWRQDEFKAFQEWTQNNKVTYRYLTASFYTKQVSVQIINKK